MNQVLVLDIVAKNWIILLLFLQEEAYCHIIAGPQDSEIEVGSQITLHCQTDIKDLGNPVEWHFKADANAPFKILFKWGKILNGNRDTMKVIANASSGHYDLMIYSVSLENAGTYTCLDEDSHKKAEMIAFDRFPSNSFCSLNLPSNDIHGIHHCGFASDQIQLSCNLRFRGYLNAQLEWSNGNGIISANISRTNGITTSTILLSGEEAQNSNVTCRVVYDNAMTSKFNWTKTFQTPPLTIITSMTIGECNPDRVECPVLSNLKCFCTWTNNNSNIIGNGSYLQLTDKPSGNYTTTAVCIVGERSCSFIAEHIDYRCESSETPVVNFDNRRLIIIVLPVVFITMGVLVVSLMTIFVSKRSRGKSDLNDLHSKESFIGHMRVTWPAFSWRPS